MYAQTNVDLLYCVGSGSNVAAVKGVESRALVYWDCGFATRKGRGCFSVVSVVYFQVEFSETS